MNDDTNIYNKIYETIFEQVPFGIAIAYNCYPDELCENNSASINDMYEQITGRKK